jgi:hypothetical protein
MAKMVGNMVHDIGADVLAWVLDQLGLSATEQVWVAINPTIAPIQGQPVAGFMILLWCKSPLLGEPHLSTASLITGVPEESAVRQVARDGLGKLADQKIQAMTVPGPPVMPGFTNDLRGFQP